MVVVVFRVFVVRFDGVGFMVTDSAVVVVGLLALCGFVDCLFGDFGDFGASVSSCDTWLALRGLDSGLRFWWFPCLV